MGIKSVKDNKELEKEVKWDLTWLWGRKDEEKISLKSDVKEMPVFLVGGT